MGFIKNDGYTAGKLGITIPEAYAKIVNVSIKDDGEATAIFNIQQSRADIAEKEPIDTVKFSSVIDKELPVYSQLYTEAKKDLFDDWENDIVEED